ncbi:MAG: M50 family metallopeptidase [Ilumatobacteraceae bacterium]
MSDFYQKFRSEIAAGGATEQADDRPTASARLSGVVMLALLVLLAVRSPWTFVFVVGLLVSVFLHEVGHYSTARLTGMKATQFYMGFGPRIWSTTRNGVEWGVRALPLGAFVRIIGMNNLDEVEPSDEPMAYRSKSFPRRLLVITAGSLMHLVIAFVLFFAVFVTAGREQQTGVATVRNVDPTTGPAREIGLRDGDVILSIGGAQVTSRDEVVAAITAGSPGDTVRVEWERDGERLSAEVVLAANPGDAARPYMGIYADDWGWSRLSPVEAVGQAGSDIVRTAVDSVKGVAVALNPLNSLRHLTDDNAPLETRPTTVVGISQVGGDIGSSEGLKGVLVLLAAVNVFVGVFNMFPLLPFDGGHAAIAIYERVRSRGGRRHVADISKMVPVATAVVGVLAVLLLTGLWLDVTRPL